MSEHSTLSQRVDFIQRTFGSFVHDRAFVNISIVCPFCAKSSSAKFKLAIRMSDWAWHCWRCGKRGRSLFPIIRAVADEAAIKEYAERFYASSGFVDNDALDSPAQHTLRLPQGFKLLTMLSRLDNRVDRAMSYLESRGVGTADLWFFKLGLSDHDDHRNRVIMPSFDAQGVLNYFVSRRIDGRAWMKYLNPKLSRMDRIFNEINIDWGNPITIVEGPFDLIKSPRNTIPLLGSQLNEQHLLFDRILVHQPCVNLMLDADAKKKALAIADLLYSYDIDVRFVQLPNDKDPGSMTKSEIRNAIDAALPWDRTMSMHQRLQNVAF